MKRVSFLLVLAVLLTVSCTNRDIESTVSGVSFTPCLQDNGQKNGLSGRVVVEFTNRGVHISHFNFEVTCDFTTVNVTHTFANGVLNIRQQGSPNNADCTCYTDVDYTINGISEREVNVIFINGVQVYCHNGGGGNENDCNVDLRIGETTEIVSGETACNSHYGLSLRVGVIHDSRCPTGAICIWAGNTEVQCRLTIRGVEHNFTLSKMGLEGGPSCEGVVIEGFKYYLEDVLPYPNINEMDAIKTVKILVTPVVENSNCDQDVIISARDYENAPNEPFYDPNVRIIDMRIVDNCLKIKFQAGGCSGNTWIVKLIDSGVIAESIPCQRTLRLSLDNRETCEALPVREISFNIEDLQLGGNNSVILHISGHTILYEY